MAGEITNEIPDLTTLPPDLIFPILLELNDEDLNSTLKLNRQLNSFNYDPYFWRERARKWFSSNGEVELYSHAIELFSNTYSLSYLYYAVKNQVAFKGSEFLFSWQRNFLSAGIQGSVELFNYFMKLFNKIEGLQYTMKGTGLGYSKANLISPVPIDNKYDRLLDKLFFMWRMFDVRNGTYEPERFYSQVYSLALGLSGRNQVNGPFKDKKKIPINTHDYTIGLLLGGFNAQVIDRSFRLIDIASPHFVFPTLTNRDYYERYDEITQRNVRTSFIYLDNNPYYLRRLYLNMSTDLSLLAPEVQAELIIKGGYLPDIINNEMNVLFTKLSNDDYEPSDGIDILLFPENQEWTFSQFNTYWYLNLLSMYKINDFDKMLIISNRFHHINTNLPIVLSILNHTERFAIGDDQQDTIVRAAIIQYGSLNDLIIPTIVFKYLAPRNAISMFLNDIEILRRGYPALKNWIIRLTKTDNVNDYIDIESDILNLIPVTLNSDLADYIKEKVISDIFIDGPKMHSRVAKMFLNYANVDLTNRIINTVLEYQSRSNKMINIIDFDAFATEMVNIPRDWNGFVLFQLLKKLVPNKRFSNWEGLFEALFKEPVRKDDSASKLSYIIRNLPKSELELLINRSDLSFEWDLILTEVLYKDRYLLKGLDLNQIIERHATPEFQEQIKLYVSYPAYHSKF